MVWSAAPVDASGVVVHEAYWNDPSYCDGHDGWDLPVMATTTMSKLDYREGDRIRMEVTLGATPPKTTFSKTTTGVGGTETTTYQHGGITRVQAGWSGQKILDYGGGAKQVVSGTSVIFYIPPAYPEDSTNVLFGSGDTFWIEYEAPAPGMARQLPGSYISGRWQTSFDEWESQQNGGCFVLDPSVLADCGVLTQTGPGGSDITFENRSSSSTGETPVIEWSLPDGTTSMADVVTRTDERAVAVSPRESCHAARCSAADARSSPSRARSASSPSGPSSSSNGSPRHSVRAVSNCEIPTAVAVPPIHGSTSRSKRSASHVRPRW